MTTEEQRLQAIIAKMTRKANAGLCQFGTEGKHLFLKDIAKLGMDEGYDVLGIKQDA